jgi:hypothetical protein
VASLFWVFGALGALVRYPFVLPAGPAHIFACIRSVKPKALWDPPILFLRLLWERIFSCDLIISTWKIRVDIQNYSCQKRGLSVDINIYEKDAKFIRNAIILF